MQFRRKPSSYDNISPLTDAFLGLFSRHFPGEDNWGAEFFAQEPEIVAFTGREKHRRKAVGRVGIRF